MSTTRTGTHITQTVRNDNSKQNRKRTTDTKSQERQIEENVGVHITVNMFGVLQSIANRLQASSVRKGSCLLPNFLELGVCFPQVSLCDRTVDLNLTHRGAA